MNRRNISNWFFDVLPFQRKSSIDWILPSVLGAGFGVAAGVGIGMLLAPRTGAETREKLRAGAENLKVKAREITDRAKGQLSTVTQQLGNGLTQSASGEMHSGEMQQSR